MKLTNNEIIDTAFQPYLNINLNDTSNKWLPCNKNRAIIVTHMVLPKTFQNQFIFTMISNWIFSLH